MLFAVSQKIMVEQEISQAILESKRSNEDNYRNDDGK